MGVLGFFFFFFVTELSPFEMRLSDVFSFFKYSRVQILTCTLHIGYMIVILCEIGSGRRTRQLFPWHLRTKYAYREQGGNRPKR